MRALVILAVLFLAPLADAVTQEQPPPLEPGARVRVTVPSRDLTKHVESFRQLRADTLVLESMWLPLSDVTRLDLYAGRQSHTLAGAGIGFLVGAGIGAIVVASAGDLDNCDPFSATECALILGGIPAGVGLLIGTVAGALSKTDKWEEVPLDRLQVSIVPTRNGFGVGARIAF